MITSIKHYDLPGTLVNRTTSGCSSAEGGDMRIGVPKEIKVLENRVGPLAGQRARDRAARARSDRRAQRRAGASAWTTTYQRAGSSRRHRGRGVRRRRHDRQGQGAAGERAQDAAPRPRCCSPTCTSRPIPSRPSDLVASGRGTASRYETVTPPTGGLPLLAPMSRSPAAWSMQAGAHYLEKRAAAASACCSAACRASSPAEVVDPRRRRRRHARARTSRSAWAPTCR